MATRVKKKKKTAPPAKKQGSRTQKKSRGAPRKSGEAEDLEVLEFIQAVDRYKRRNQKAFPAWSEILAILKSLGYRKV